MAFGKESMSVTPSIFSRSPRTAAAQPPHVMLGTLSVTSVYSEDVDTLDVSSELGVAESSDPPQPIRVAAKQQARNANAALFITLCSWKNKTNRNTRHRLFPILAANTGPETSETGEIRGRNGDYTAAFLKCPV